MLPLAFSPSFTALLKETQLTRDILGAGATQLRRANYAEKGTYFLAFTGLATGLDRLGKLCLMLDHLLQHGHWPELAQLKQDVGYRLLLIHERIDALALRRGLRLQFRQRLDDPMHLTVLRCLHDFAESDRYADLQVQAAPVTADPLADWIRLVDVPLFQKRVSARKQVSIRHSTDLVARLMGAEATVLQDAETADAGPQLMDADYGTAANAVAPHRQLSVLQIVRHWVEVLGELQRQALQVRRDMPDLAEAFNAFLCADHHLKARKTW
ncbi:MAG: hypothetical protein LCH73_02260 [Proteobacteria bacterium]|nr:hypothetical protein [Pseudomonadota bacterium]